MKFNEMKYERVDYELTSSKMNELLDAMEKAQNKETFLDLFFKLNDVRSHLFTMMILCSIRHSINTADEFYDEETNYWNETSPLFEAIEDRMRKICDEVSFKVEGYEDTQITLGLEPGVEYKIMIDGIVSGMEKTNLGGKFVFSAELNDTPKEIKVCRFLNV